MHDIVCVDLRSHQRQEMMNNVKAIHGKLFVAYLKARNVQAKAFNQKCK